MADDLRLWLQRVGLGQHADIFAANDIDLDLLPDLSEEDLKELGLSLGHRRRLFRAIAELSGAAAAPPKTAAIAGGSPADTDAASREAERRQLTVLFCDLVGSTELSRQYDPEDLRELLRRYHDAIAAEVRRFGGYVANYLGDGVLAYFGWPRAQEDDAAQAIRAGLAAVAAARELALRVHVGIASGIVVVGDLDGAEGRQAGAIAGETPNLAARLETLAGPDQVAISELTHQLVGATFILDDLGLQEVKGIAEPVPVWLVLAERAVESRFDARAGRLSRFVGRDHELALLLDRFQRACTGEGQAILLSGEAGIGKSRILERLHEKLAATPHTRLRFQCAPSHTDSALYPVIRHIEYAAGFMPEDGPDIRLDKLEALLRHGIDGIRESAALVAPLLSLPAAERYGPIELSPELRNERTLRVLIDQLVGLAAKQPVLYLLEDAHWIDPTTRELVTRTLARIGDVRVLLVITHRPDFQSDWARHPQVTALSLNRLSQAEGAEVARAAGGEALSEEILVRIMRRADGVPLFIEELTRSVVETGDLFGDSGVPETLQASLLARLDRLGGEAKDLAQLAAVIGREFGAELLGAVADKPADVLAHTLERLVGSHIVLPTGSPNLYAFRHALLQDAAYQSLLFARRRQYHHDIAEALERRFPERAENEPEIVARHYTAAGEPESAIPYWLRAGKRALARFAAVEAIAHFERGLQLARGLPEAKGQVLRLLLALADALGRRENRLREALETFREAAALALEVGSPGELAQAALGLEDIELYTGGARYSIELLETALNALGPDETIERCRVLSQLGRALLDRGEIERANELSRSAINMARRLGDRRALLDALLCASAARTGHPYPASQFSEIRASVDEMVAAAEDIGDPILVERALARMIPAALEMGDRASFDAMVKRHSDSLGRHDEDHHVYFNASMQAMRAILSGEFAEAERLAQLAFDVARDFTDEYAAGVYGVQMFTIRREQGRLGEVAPVLRRFIEENPRDAAWRPGMALIAGDLGFRDAARKAFDDLAVGGFVFPIDAKRCLSLSYLAEVCTRLGDAERGDQLYELLLPYRDLAVIAPVATVCCGSAARYLGMLAGCIRDWAAAEEHFEAALILDEQLQAWPWLAHSKHEFALMLRARGARGDQGRAVELLAAAAASAERIGMPALLDKIRSVGH